MHPHFSFAARDWTEILKKLLTACDAAEFARGAFYVRPGGQIDLSCRFADLLLRHVRNVSVVVGPAHDGLEKLVVTDLETNATLERLFSVERQVMVGALLVDADESAVQAQVAILIPRIRRPLVLGLAPDEVRLACVQRCVDVTLAADGKDLAAQTKTLMQQMATAGVDSATIKSVLGKPATEATAKDLLVLRGWWSRVRDGEVPLPHPSVAALAATPEKPKPRGGRKAAADKPPERKRRGSSTTAASPPPPKEEPPKPRTSRRDDEDSASSTDGTDPPSTPAATMTQHSVSSAAASV